MRQIANRVSILAILLLMGVSVGWAQQQGQSQQQQGQTQQPGSQQKTTQKPSGQNGSSPEAPISLSVGQSGSQQQSSQGQSQTTSEPSSAPPLTGAEEYTLSQMGVGRSYWIPSFQFSQSVSTSGTGAFGTSTLDAISTVSGLFAFHHVWSKYDFTARYAGTGFIYDRHSSLNTSAHAFSLSQRIQGRRSTFLLTDSVSYLPESSFGYARFSGNNGLGLAGYGYGGLYGASGGMIDSTFLPNQSVLTGTSSRVSNSVVAEYTYLTSPLSSLTITGSYMLLEFPNSNYINNNEAVFQIGYNRSFTYRDSIGLSYQGGVFRYNQASGNFTNHVAQFSYRHLITQRLRLQLGGGPDIVVYNNSAPGQSTRVSWEASTALDYQFRRFLLDTAYQHFTSGGSGVYQGANTDNANVSITTELTRMWSTTWDLGYSHNTNLRNINPSSTGISYNTWYGSVNFQRLVNRWMSLFLSYSLQQQRSSVSTCGLTVAGPCGTFYTQQYFSFGFNWHPSRIAEEYNDVQQ